MHIEHNIRGVREYLDRLRREGTRVAFVPTMGALHEGHLSLMRIARRQADCVVISIFVNPLQFNSPADLESYPRTLESDCRAAAEVGVDLVFAPNESEMYPWLSQGFQGQTCRVSAPSAAEGLEGAHRPGHFDGVVTVVAAMFNIVDPDLSVFGQKDYQQALVIGQLISHLHYRTELVLGPTIREADGLAMSSRNARLASGDRPAALGLSQGLFTLEEVCRSRKVDAEEARSILSSSLADVPGLELEYAEIADIDTLEPLSGAFEQAQALVAAQVGSVRLIDNIRL